MGRKGDDMKDWATRRVEKAIGKPKPPQKTVMMRSDVVETLLRAERARMVRLIQQMPCVGSGKSPCPSPNPDACLINRNDLLATLKARRK
jgi:hypothetical protein